MNDLSRLFERFEQGPPSELSKPDAERLAQLIQSDSRCCALLPRSFSSRRERARFRRVLTQAWVDEEYAEVLDYRQRLLRSAAQHRRQRAPLVALILYATWIEHTVNAIVIGAGRINGPWEGHIDDLARHIVAVDFPKRLSQMWSRYQAPKLNRTMKARILRFMELRNDFIHYKWIGHHPARLEVELTHMRTVVISAPTLVSYLREIEHQVTTAKFRPRIRKLLGLRTRKVQAA